eukprot:SAG11_NODE_17445_length_514_cov_1.797136_1_plen_133_part_01
MMFPCFRFLYIGERSEAAKVAGADVGEVAEGAEDADAEDAGRVGSVAWLMARWEEEERMLRCWREVRGDSVAAPEVAGTCKRTGSKRKRRATMLAAAAVCVATAAEHGTAAGVATAGAHSRAKTRTGCGIPGG